jgi:hypothetical protein
MRASRTAHPFHVIPAERMREPGSSVRVVEDSVILCFKSQCACGAPCAGSRVSFRLRLHSPGMTGRGGNAFGLAAFPPEGMAKSEGSAGAETLRSCCNKKGSLAAPAPVVPRVRSHRQRAHRSGSRLLRESLSRPGPRAAAPQMRPCEAWLTSGAPLRDGRPCSLLPSLHSPGPRRRNLRRASPRVRRYERCSACLNRVTAPAPQSRSAARPIRAGVSGVWGRREERG